MPEITSLERAARAIAKNLGIHPWGDCIAAARAAITALREPTPEMLEAATSDLPDWGELPDDWRKMIDFILEEGGNALQQQSQSRTFTSSRPNDRLI